MGTRTWHRTGESRIIIGDGVLFSGSVQLAFSVDGK
jgi:hypothetical protein